MLTRPTPLAVDNSGQAPAEDPSAGDVYVTNTVENPETLETEHVVDKFSATGAYIGRIAAGAEGLPFGEIDGLAVDSGGKLWVYQESHEIDSFTNGVTNAFDSSRESHAEGLPAHGFAVGSGGDVFVVHRIAHKVARLDAAGDVINEEEELGGKEEIESVATDQSTGDVYLDDGTELAEFDAEIHAVAQFGSAQLASGGEGAVSIDPLSGRVYVSNMADGRVYGYARTPGPRVQPDAASGLATTVATAHGTVNPEGAAITGCVFEYGESRSYGLVSACEAPDAGEVGAGTSFVPVHAPLSNLQSGTAYHYRVVATDAAGNTIASADTAFTTLPTPTITGETAADLSSASADLSAAINPRGSETHYRLEYGKTVAYGTSVPVPPLPEFAIGSGEANVAVTQHVTGLEEDITYHWRVVATNANGVTTGADHSFIYSTKGASLPDGRAYELVSPAKKNGALLGDLHIFGLAPMVAGDGSRVVGSTLQCFGESESCTAIHNNRTGTSYAFTRTSSGWQAQALAPAAREFASNTIQGYDPDTGVAVFELPTAPGGEEDWYARSLDGSLLRFGPHTPPSGGPFAPSVSGLTMTGDESHFVWQDTLQGGPAHEWAFDGTKGHANAQTVYEYSGADNSQPVLVGVSGGPGSTDLISSCETYLGGPSAVLGYTSAGTGLAAVSQDGSTVYFTAAGADISGCVPGPSVPATTGLYARFDEARTVEISERAPEPECHATCQSAPPGDAQFQGASSDGSKAFFTSTQQLMDAASEDSQSGDTALDKGCSQTTGANGCNLYENECSDECKSPSGRRLRDISGGDTSGGGPRVEGVVAISPDGSHAYFVARGVLTGVANMQGQTAQNGAANLYLFELDATYPEGHIAFITAGGGGALSETSSGGLTSNANVTPDGRFLVFTSNARLTPDDTSVSGARQVFRYDAQTAELVRVSIGDNGFGDDGNRSAATPCFGSGLSAECSEDARIAPLASSTRPDPTMSDDGAYVFFQSPVALTPGALDDAQIATSTEGPSARYAQNIYEWHDGHVYLISDGRDRSLSHGHALICGRSVLLSSVCLLGADRTGANVFFSTADELVSQDTDTELDYYDARICTNADPCISSPALSTECFGEGCHGAPSVPPADGSPGTATFDGPGNFVPSVVATAPKQLTRAQKFARAVRACRRMHKRHRRLVCEGQARRRYRPAQKGKRATSRKGAK